MADYTITVRLKGEDGVSSTVKTVSGSINQLGNSADAASQKSTGLKAAMGKFKSELLGIGTAFGLVKFGQMIGDLNEIGMKANAAENTFTALSGGTQQAALNLDRMRDATRGVVDDMTLMNGANRLLLMGLASTGEEAASLASGAVALGKAMGMDAGSAVSDFAALLANRSIPRLDNFGISAANVRAEMEKLKAAGYGLEEAFNMAVMAEMEVSLDKLGPSLDANATAFERWGARIQNAVQDAGQGIAAGFEGMALMLEVTAGIHPAQQQLREDMAALQALDFQDMFRDILGFGPDMTGGQQQAIGQIILAMQQEALNDPAVANNAEELWRRAIGKAPEFDMQFYDIEAGDYSQIEGVYADTLIQQVYEQRTAYNELMRNEEEANAEIQAALDERAAMYARFDEEDFSQHLINQPSQLKEASDEFDTYTDAIGRAQAQQRALFDEFDKTIPAAPSTLIEASDANEAYWEQQVRIRQGTTMLAGVIDGAALQYTRLQQVGGTAFQTLMVMGQQWGEAQTSLAGSMGAIGSGFAALGLNPADFGGDMMDFQLPDMSGFVSQDTMNQMNSMYQQAQLELQNIQSLAAQGLIPQSEVTKAENMVSNLGTMVGQLQTIQQLSDITGQTGGGILGELGTIVMGQAGAGGMSDEEIAALERAINLASGAETASSVALEEQAAPLILAIAEQVGPQAAAEALQALQANLESATLAGMSQEEIAAMIPQFTGYAMGEGGMVSQIPQMIAASFGGAMLDPGATGDTTGKGAVTMSGEMAALEEKLPIVGELMLPVKEAAGAYAASMTEAKTSLTASISGAEVLRQTLDGMGEERTLRVRIEAIDPNGVLALAGTAGASLGQTVRDNGGRVPGVDARIPQ